MKTKVHGSCHCKKITFTAHVDMSEGTSRCNCTFCQKTRYWGMHVQPEDFQLLTGEKSLRSYSKTVQDQDYDPNRALGLYENDLAFCKTCGTHAFNTGNIPEIGGHYVSINVACLDGVDFKEFMQAPIEYMNGKDDDWFSAPSYTGHL